MVTCKKCKSEKADDQMKLRNGVPSKVCLECDEAAKAERRRLKKVLEDAREESVRTRKKKKKSAAAPARRAKPKVEEPEPTEAVVMIAPGLGCRAFLTEDDRLQIAQRNDDKSYDNIVLSKTEFKVIAAQFHDWMETHDPS